MEFDGFHYPDASAHQMVEEITDTDTVIFAEIPNIQGPKWPKDIQRAWKRMKHRHRFEPERDYIAVPISGTTFSGDPVKTTLGNTFRSMLYMYFYIHFLVNEPWKSDQIFVMASGDDVVVLGEPNLINELSHMISLM